MWLHSLLLSIALSCSWSTGALDDFSSPTLRLSGITQQNGSDVVLFSGSAFNLSCHGNASVQLSSSSFVRLLDNQQLEVRTSTSRHSGTYRCGYIPPSLQHLHTWIYLYIPDPGDPSSTFVTSNRAVLSLEEGEDYMLKCLLTDPLVTNLTLQSSERGRSLPPGMKVTIDPRRGVLIHDPKTTFSGSYVCAGLKDGRQVFSKPIELLVVSRRWRGPPSVFIGQKETVRLMGEEFRVTCASSNPSHLFNLTWTHALIQTMNISDNRHYFDRHMYLNSTVVVSKVRRAHAGRYTCTGTSEGGVATATTWLHVIDRPFLKVYLQSLSWNTRINGSIPTQPQVNATRGSLVADVSAGVNSTDVNNISLVEVYEGRDVTITFVIDSYPPIINQFWTTPKHTNDITELQKIFVASSYSLLLRRVRQGDEGRYSFHFSNSYFNGSQSIDLRIISSPFASVSVEGDYFSCRSSGYPPPLLLLYSCHGHQQTCGNISSSPVPLDTVTSEEGEEVRTRHPLAAENDVTVECVASNLAGESRAIIRPRPPQTLFTLPLIGALTASAILLLLLLVVFYKYRQKPRYELRWKIIDGFDGNNYTFIDPSQLPYNHKWEFPRDKLRLGAVLGSGAFGKVVEATAFGLETDNKETRVAVKMLKPSAHSEESEALMSELKILSHLGFHDNIVNLLGACTKGGPMLMITEYCCHGDLLNYLRTHAQSFVTSMLKVDKVEDTVFYKNINGRLRSDSGISCCSDYQDMQPTLNPGRTHPGIEGSCLSVVDLLWFSYQVAQGLDFLSSRNCIHRDVAARNVLLTDSHVAKICDFGLARDIQNDESYIVQGNSRLPVKWMSPESIFDCVYTVQSDVWSYGVLLWEIFSLGKSPYPNVVVDTNFYKMIKDGRHMEQPDYAPPQMYQLMTLCWSLEPTDRPTFKMIGQLIDRLLPSTNKKLPRHCEKPAYRNIDESKEENQEGGGRKRGEDEQGDRHDNSEADDDDEKEPVMRNIYQRS